MMPATRHDPMAALSAVPEVALAVENARTACAELRWHPALRRRADQVRAEAGVWAAQASAEIDGVRLPVGLVRDVVRGATPPPADAAGALMMGAVRANAEGEALAAHGARRWQVSGRQALARLHTASAAGVLPADRVGRPLLGSEGRLKELVSLLTAASSAPAPVLGAVVHAELAVGDMFEAVSGVMSRAAARSLTLGLGLDPMGVAVPERFWARDPRYLSTALDAYRSGTIDGVATWVVQWCEALVEGVTVGRQVCDSVLGGTPVA